MQIQTLAIAGGVGLLAGTHAAIWGLYKDAVYEGLGRGRFVRSMLLGAISALLLQLAFQLPLPGAGASVILFGLAYAAERTIVELWKTFVRQEDQSKYFIPMQFSIRGIPVASRGVRALVGIGCVAALAGVLSLISLLDGASMRLARPFDGMGIGLLIGTLIAIGGCWKDAPTEGFDALKFFRSPTVTLVAALVLSWLTESYLQIAIASVGVERAAVETYKTFIQSKPPGKFFGKPIRFPHVLEVRKHFVPVYAAITAMICILATVATAARAAA